ncbi:MAG: DUF1648 domain-containing protein [Lachnospiraceae bacterium]|nr:DUF1648 domain-containing protein [Lachnospiraceae bacterium]
MANIHQRKIDIIVYAVCLIAVIGMFIYAAAAHDRLPEQIPTQFGILGKISGYGSRNSVFTLPGVLLVLLPSLIIVGMFPAAWNLPSIKVTEANAPYIAACVRNMLDVMLLTITATMTTIFVCQVRNTDAPVFLFPLMLVIFLVNIIVCIVRAGRISRRYS